MNMLINKELMEAAEKQYAAMKQAGKTVDAFDYSLLEGMKICINNEPEDVFTLFEFDQDTVYIYKDSE